MCVRARPVISSSFIGRHRTGYDAAMKSRALKTLYLSAAAGAGLLVTAALWLVIMPGEKTANRWGSTP